MCPLNTDGCLIEVTTWEGLTVFEIKKVILLQRLI